MLPALDRGCEAESSSSSPSITKVCGLLHCWAWPSVHCTTLEPPKAMTSPSETGTASPPSSFLPETYLHCWSTYVQYAHYLIKLCRLLDPTEHCAGTTDTQPSILEWSAMPCCQMRGCGGGLRAIERIEVAQDAPTIFDHKPAGITKPLRGHRCSVRWRHAGWQWTT